MPRLSGQPAPALQTSRLVRAFVTNYLCERLGVGNQPLMTTNQKPPRLAATIFIFITVALASSSASCMAQASGGSGAVRRHAVEELAGLIEARYLFPDIGERYAKALRDASASGAYDRIARNEDFAARLTADLQAVHPDLHLRVFPFDASIPQQGQQPPSDAGPPSNPIERAEWSAPGIATIGFLSLGIGEQATAPVDQFMADHRGAKALIIDLRQCLGGTPVVFEELASYFVAAPTRTIIMDMRAAASSPQFEQMMANNPTIKRVDAGPDIVRTEEWIQPRAAAERWPKTPIYILISHQTISAGEHMAFAFRILKLATIVGETTAGGGHFGGAVPFDERRFSVFIPWGRAYDPATGKDWEGAGVVPDITVPASDALAKAIALAKAAPQP